MSNVTRRRTARRTSAPTLRDVAEHAGVSSMTVSRVINNASGVREQTRRKVNDAIRALDYSPNEAARRLAGAQQIHIAMIYSQWGAYIAECLLGGLERAHMHGAQFIIEHCQDPASAATEIERIVAEGADGILLAPPMGDNPQVIEFVQANSVPAVAITSSRMLDGISSIGIDGQKAAREMARHLIELGHRRIAFIAGHPQHAASAHRLEGYREALLDAGIAVDDDLVASGLFTYRSGLDAAEHLLSLDPLPTAIFASNDDMAAAAAAVAHRLGLDVPADLSIVGFDDTPLATAIWPQLTTILVPGAELARSATDQLVKTIRATQVGEQVTPKQIILDYTLVRRHSDAPPRVRPQIDAVAPTLP